MKKTSNEEKEDAESEEEEETTQEEMEQIEDLTFEPQPEQREKPKRLEDYVIVLQNTQETAVIR